MGAMKTYLSTLIPMEFSAPKCSGMIVTAIPARPHANSFMFMLEHVQAPVEAS